MQSKPSFSGTARRLAAALLVAIGFAIAWGLVWGWIGMLVSSWTEHGSNSYDSIVVKRDGTPVIQTYSYTDYQNISYRTLDGKSVNVKSDELLGPAFLTAPPQPPRIAEQPLGWGQSVSASDFARPRGAWYLVRNNKPLGRAVFMGYDAFARLPIGYLSRQGFSHNLPPEEDWFDMGRRQLSYNQGAASPQYLSYNSAPDLYDFDTDEERLIPQWVVYVIDADQLKEINLQERTVRSIFESPDLVSVNILTEPKDFADEADSQSKEKTEPRLAIRAADRLVILNPASGDKRDFVLPEQFRELQFSAYSIGPDQLFLDWTKRENGRWREYLAWLERDGTISREESPHFSQYDIPPGNERLEAMLVAGLMPIPVGWAAVTTIFAPLGELQDNEQPTYVAAVRHFLDTAWPALIAVTIVGAIAAWLVLRLQRRYFRPRTFAWCTFAFLLGLPGLAAYWLEHRRAKLEACGECETVVPRDRDTCAKCNNPFAAPPLVGTEIFA